MFLECRVYTHCIRTKGLKVAKQIRMEETNHAYHTLRTSEQLYFTNKNNKKRVRAPGDDPFIARRLEHYNLMFMIHSIFPLII